MMPKQQSNLLFRLWQHQHNVRKTDAAVEKASDDDKPQKASSTGMHQALNLTCQCLRRTTDTPPFDFAFFKKTDAAVEKASDDDKQQKVSSTGTHQALNLTCQCLRRTTDTPPFDFAFFEHARVGKNENLF